MIDSTTIRWLRVFLLSAWVAAGIAMASLSWDASVTALATENEYEFKDNTLVEQRVGLNKWLIIGYSSLALLGAVGYCYGNPDKLSLTKFWVLFPIVFWLWCGMSMMWSVEPGLSIRRIGHLYLAIAGAFGVATLLTRQETIWTIVFSMTILALLGIVAELSHGVFNPLRSNYRFCGIGHPNETALFAAVSVLAARVAMMILPTRDQAKWIVSPQWIALGFMLFGIFIVLITKSRTTAASLILAAFLVQLVLSKSTSALMLFSTSMSACAFVGLMLSMASTSTVNTVFGIAAIGRSSHIGTLTGRLPLWEEILKGYSREPVFGFGYGAYWTTKRVEDFAQMFYWEPPNGHSIYIDSLVETGTIGFLLLTAALLVCSRASIITYKKNLDASQLFAVGIIHLAIIHGLTESSFFKGCFGPLMFAVAVFTLLRARDEQRAASISPSPEQPTPQITGRPQPVGIHSVHTQSRRNQPVRPDTAFEPKTFERPPAETKPSEPVAAPIPEERKEHIA